MVFGSNYTVGVGRGHRFAVLAGGVGPSQCRHTNSALLGALVDRKIGRGKVWFRKPLHASRPRASADYFRYSRFRPLHEGSVTGDSFTSCKLKCVVGV